MTDRQQVLAQQLLASALSLPGYTQAVSIMAFENVLRELNAPRAGLAAAEFRHAGKYQFSFFGEPHAEQTWAWRMVGHHVAVNFTIVDGTYVAPTPLLFGSEPPSSACSDRSSTTRTAAFYCWTRSTPRSASRRSSTMSRRRISSRAW